MMYQHVLSAVDLSDLSSVVFEQALWLSKLCRAKLILLHVLSSDEEGYPPIETVPYDGIGPVLTESYIEQWKLFEQQSLEHVKTFAAQAQEQGVEIETLQVPGMPGAMICDIAREKAVDLIVMGNRGRSGLSELLLGSQSNYVMRRAPCSVLVIRSKSQASNEEQRPHSSVTADMSDEV
jgi:nucleotide-binding universal stress UspA family protein